MANENGEENGEELVPPAEPEASEPKVQEPTEEEKKIQAANEELIQLGKAKAEALAELSRIRAEKRAEKQSPKKDEEEEELPQINLRDPSAKAWDEHMNEKVKPFQEYESKARAEVREYALQEFLKEKPALAKDPEKLKELMSVYERLHTASEITVYGVLTDLNRSYGAITYQEREDAENQERRARAEADAQFSEPAISKGASGYRTTSSKKMPNLSEEEKALILKQGWTVEDWWKAKQEQEAANA